MTRFTSSRLVLVRYEGVDIDQGRALRDRPSAFPDGPGRRGSALQHRWQPCGASQEDVRGVICSGPLLFSHAGATVRE
jgi:hypothetical protein